MSNIGLINPAEFRLGDFEPYDAVSSGAIKFKPYMQLALTTFSNEITFSIGVRVTDKEQLVFENFLKKVTDELYSFAYKE